MQKWEYKVIFVKRVREQSFTSIKVEWDYKTDIEEELKSLGENGWELVSVVPIADHHANNSGCTDELRYIFKRPK